MWQIVRTHKGQILKSPLTSRLNIITSLVERLQYENPLDTFMIVDENGNDQEAAYHAMMRKKVKRL